MGKSSEIVQSKGDATMATMALALTALVALEHFGFMLLEMFFWQTPYARKAFGTTAETAATSATLAANQGLYNGFLVAGLVWGLWAGKADVVMFFLGCVIVAGIYGAATVKPRIFFVQALPALLAVGAWLLSGR
jgi:putative membrane protein